MVAAQRDQAAVVVDRQRDQRVAAAVQKLEFDRCQRAKALP